MTRERNEEREGVGCHVHNRGTHMVRAATPVNEHCNRLIFVGLARGRDREFDEQRGKGVRNKWALATDGINTGVTWERGRDVCPLV